MADAFHTAWDMLKDEREIRDWQDDTYERLRLSGEGDMYDPRQFESLVEDEGARNYGSPQDAQSYLDVEDYLGWHGDTPYREGSGFTIPKSFVQQQRVDRGPIGAEDHEAGTVNMDLFYEVLQQRNALAQQLSMMEHLLNSLMASGSIMGASPHLTSDANKDIGSKVDYLVAQGIPEQLMRMYGMSGDQFASY